ncbi:MAG: tetratricopeptide repeat protein [Anaerolineales bacterium]|nr:tetratricopeptide repeat protein [Anaerolineales bacterium]
MPNLAAGASVPASLTARLMAELPESLWPEGLRRLRRLPLLQDLAQNDEVRRAFVTQAKRYAAPKSSKGLGGTALGGEAAAWQPGPLALAAYAVRHPECQGDAEAWLIGAGRDRLAAAYTMLTQTQNPLHPVDEAVPAALALRLRMAATDDWSGLAAEAGADTARWRLPLQLLWGLWSGDREAFFTALLRGTAPSAGLAANCLVVNLAPGEIVEFVARLGLDAPDGQWLAFAQALEAAGEREAARQVLRPRAMATAAAAAKSLPPAWNPLELNISYELERSLLTAATEDFGLAQPVLAAAWTQLRQLRATIAGHIGRLALAASDLIVAHEGYRDAFTEQPEVMAYRVGLAQTLTKLGRVDEALALLDGQNDPAAQAAQAEAFVVTGQTEQARETLKGLALDVATDAEVLAATARLLAGLNEPALAAAHLQRAARLDRTDAAKQLAAAQALLAHGSPEAAAEFAQEAAALTPQSPAARETFGRALLAAHQPAAAVPHFRAAVAADERRLPAALGLAEAALAAKQPELAAEAAGGVLFALGPTDQLTPEQVVQMGQAHTFIGQALSYQHQEEQAFEHFRRASAIVPAAPEPWRAMAAHYLRQGDEPQALATLEAGRQALAVIASPESAPLLSDLAERYVAAGRPTEGILALREATKANPKGATNHRRLGALLRRQGSLAEAVECLRQALALQPTDGEAHYELAQALEKLGQPDEAWSEYQQATLVKPVQPDPYLDLGRITLAQVRKGVSGASPLQAMAALRAALERAPSLAEAHGLLAQAQHLAGDPTGALDSYQKALHLAPTRTDWSLGLGQVCLDLKQPEIAIAALHDALDHAPDSPAVHTAQAHAYAQSGLWPEARRAAEAAHRLDPEDPQIVRLLAEAATSLGDNGAAVAAWRQAVALNPHDAAMQVRLARCLLDLGEVEEARSVYTAAIALAPNDAAVHHAAGLALLELGETEEACQVAAQAVALAPHTAAYQATYGRIAAEAHKFDTAHAAYLQAAELDEGPQRPAHLREAGEALWSMQRQAAAVALWQRALNLTPNEHGLRSRLGLAQLQLGQYEEALELLEQALRQNPRDGQLAREAARAALLLGRLEHAAELLQGAIDLNPGDAEARHMLGQVRERQGDSASALELYRQAARVNPGDGRHLAAAAATLAASGKLADGLAVVESAVRLSPDSSEVQAQAGELYLEARRPAEAVKAFQAAAQACPTDGAAHLALARALVVAAEEDERGLRAKLPAARPATDPHGEVVAVLQKAAALGADPIAVRYWLGRAKAVAGDAREAQRLLESVVAANPAGPAPQAKGLALTAAVAERPTPALYRALGAALRKSGQPERAREALHAAIQAEPANAEAAMALVELGLTDLDQGDQPSALANFRRAVAAAPNLALGHYHLGETLLAAGDLQDAAQVLQRALALNPTAAAWHHRLAQVYLALYEAGSPAACAAALGHLQRATELQPDNATYAADLARALVRDGDLAAALTHFERATTTLNADPELWTERGQAHLLLSDHPAAEKCFAQALELAPDSAAALLGSARVSFAQGKLADAARLAEAAVRAAPGEAEALTCLADIAASRGEAAAAERHYTDAAAKAARPAPALLALGRLYAQQQKWDKALTVLERAASAETTSDEIYAALGEVHAASGNHALATKAFREAARIAPRRAGHLLRLGRACRAQGQLDQALSHLMQARDLAPTDDEVLREIGLVFDQRKQYDRALEIYKHAIEVAPKSAHNYTRAGVALRNLKRVPEALVALERAVALDPKNLEATRQLAMVSAMHLVTPTPKAAASA